MKRSTWSRRLDRPIDVQNHGQLATLSDVRKFLLRLAPERQAHAQWQNVAAAALQAATDGSTAGVSVALQLALQISGVDYELK